MLLGFQFFKYHKGWNNSGQVKPLLNKFFFSKIGWLDVKHCMYFEALFTQVVKIQKFAFNQILREITFTHFKPQNCHFDHFHRSEYWHLGIFAILKFDILQKIQIQSLKDGQNYSFLPLWSQLAVISRKIRVALKFSFSNCSIICVIGYNVKITEI